MTFSRFSPGLVAGSAACGASGGGAGIARPPARAYSASEPPLRIPADLAAFIASTTARQACAVLGASGAQLKRLRAGDAKALRPRALRRWRAYQAQGSQPVGPWQVRKVGAGGVVCLDGRRFASAALQPGSRVLVALLASGALLVKPIPVEDGIVAEPLNDGGQAS